MPEGDQRNIREKSKDYWRKIRGTSEGYQKNIGGRLEENKSDIRGTSEGFWRRFGESGGEIVGGMW
jgi:hypothetical protein